jgi:hypothetical protein
MKRPFLTFALLPYLLAGAGARADLPLRIGWVEMSRIHPGNMMFATKFDTGAKSSSINAHDIERFEKDGQQWVRFQVKNRKGAMMTLERPVVREVTIKRHGGKKELRPVVMLGICVGTTYAEAEVSLRDRTGFLYPLLAGRTYIAGRFAIDPERKFTRDPECKETRLP